jgi:hypothetical protein
MGQVLPGFIYQVGRGRAPYEKLVSRISATSEAVIPAAIFGKSVCGGLGRSQTRFIKFPHPRYGEAFSSRSILAS